MFGKDPTEKLDRSFYPTNDSGFFGVRVDGGVPGTTLGGHSTDPMQRVPPLENLQVTWPQVEGRYFMATPVEDFVDAVKPFIVSASDVGRIFKQAATVSLLHQDRDSEVVGVEVPGKKLPRVQNI
jgi:hypothetical protein